MPDDTQEIVVTAPRARLARPQIAGLSAVGLTALAAVLANVYHHEGGYVNNPADHGGATRYGVTERVARQSGYLGDMRDFPQNCYGEGVVCADAIYVRDYIAGPGFAPLLEIEPVIADKLVDIAVNMGQARPGPWLQTSLNASVPTQLKVDGRVGPATIGAYRQLQQRVGKVRACTITFTALATAQETFYRSLARRQPSQQIFLNGWVRRARAGHPESCGKGAL